ncbi:apoptosis-stimulating of p53 protein 1-like isoform X2 [Acanthaster planci]|uniref:Apoptosis-stimulating of p53 protein 1-like isoform X2 n=1 Tax=Acanthaster planci TaxID=133434 RepID=A0A8B7XQY8_ACAPL|nr:apoptosis-stimulating of p53 protein 1-like isoform X2 [Acanthaster planci]
MYVCTCCRQNEMSQERPVHPEEHIFDILRQWGAHSNEVKFYLRHQSAKVQEVSSSDYQGQRMRKSEGMQEDLKIPPGVDLSLSELQDMAERQQHQIEAQQQTLVAKQQRLKFLKQQEQKQQQMAAEDERLRRLRDKVDSQEQKLRKLRTLRGQADATKNNNHTLSTELESVRTLFAQKEKELALAVAKVEELTQQLEQLKQGNLNGINGDVYRSPANEELDRLRKELLLRNRLNEEQSATLQKQRQTMVQRKEEMAVVDKRIEELTERLRKTRILGKPQLPPPGANVNNNASVPVRLPNGNVQLDRPFNGSQPRETGNRMNSRNDPRGMTGDPGRRSPLTNGDLSGPPPPGGSAQGRPGPTSRPMPPKPATLFPPQSFKPRTNQSGTSGVPRQGSPMSASRPHQAPASWHSTSLDNVQQSRSKPEGVNESGSDTSSLTENSSVDSMPTSGLSNQQQGPSRRPDNRSSPIPQNQRSGSPLSSQPLPVPKADPRLSSLSERRAGDRSPMYDLASLEAALSPPPQELLNDRGPPQQGDWRPPGFGPGQASGSPSRQANQPSGNVNRTETDSRTRSVSTDSVSSQSSNRHPPSPQGKKKPPPPPRAVTTGLSSARPNQLTPSSPSRVGPAAPNGQRYPSVSSQPSSAPFRNEGPQYGPTPAPSTHPGSPKLSGGRSSGSSSPVTGQHNGSPVPVARPQPGSPRSDHTAVTNPPASVNSDIPPPRPELPQPYSTAAPDPTRPRHQRSPATVGMFVPPPPAQMRNYNRPSYEKGLTSTDSGKKNLAVRSLFPDVQPNPPGRILPGNAPSAGGLQGPQPSREEDDIPLSPNRPPSPLNLPMSHLYHHPDFQRLRNMPRPLKKRLSYSEDKESLNFLKIGGLEPTVSETNQEPDLPKPEPQPNNTSKKDEDENFRNNAILSQKQYTAALSQLSRSPVISNRTSTGKGEVKGILKKEGALKKTIRVRFDPLALLLDASLEGEFDLVRRIMPEVPNPSGANDEGITALHNAICANHYEIVNFLIMNGVDVNAPDSDGWTPLHCAASCNNVIMVRNLVEHGACIFATTISDKETAADKCEEEEDGFKMCSQYLFGVQEKMGFLNGGRIFAVYSYTAEKPDELSFKDGEELTVIRRGDEEETEWWWAKKGEQMGYVPRNLFGLFPRVRPLF